MTIAGGAQEQRRGVYRAGGYDDGGIDHTGELATHGFHAKCTEDKMAPFSLELFHELRGADVIHCHQYFVLPTFLASALDMQYFIETVTTEADQVKVVDTYTVEFHHSAPSALTPQIQAICLYVYDSVLAREHATDDDAHANAATGAPHAASQPQPPAASTTNPPAAKTASRCTPPAHASQQPSPQQTDTASPPTTPVTATRSVVSEATIVS